MFLPQALDKRVNSVGCCCLWWLLVPGLNQLWFDGGSKTVMIDTVCRTVVVGVRCGCDADDRRADVVCWRVLLCGSSFDTLHPHLFEDSDGNPFFC